MTRIRLRSLRAKLMVWITLPVLVAGLIIAVMAFTFSRDEIEEVYDAQMVFSAKELLTLVGHEVVELKDNDLGFGLRYPEVTHRYEGKIGYRIWYRERRTLKSPNTAAFAGFEAPPGFSTQNVNGEAWRFFVLVDAERGLRIEVSQEIAIRRELIGQLISSLVIPGLLLVPTVVLVVWIAVQRSLSVLVDLSRSVDRRHATDLIPVPDTDAPTEVIPLVRALNRLFGRLEESFRREREFTDDAAHELRTPLAAMRTQTQVLMMKAHRVPELAGGFENLNASVLRATHLVEQLLSLARLQHETPELRDVDIAAVTRAAIEALGVAAGRKNLKLAARIPDQVGITGHADTLGIMIRNLLDNAIKYSPAGATITVTLEPGRLVIADNGPGLAAEERTRVFERFVRADRTGEPGSGLGLSIVRRIADIHDAQVSLGQNSPQGLTATVTWPVAVPSKRGLSA